MTKLYKGNRTIWRFTGSLFIGLMIIALFNAVVRYKSNDVGSLYQENQFRSKIEAELHEVQYNIVTNDDKFYAISWHEGAFDLEKAKNNQYKDCYVSDSLQDLKCMVYQAVEKQYKKQIEELAKIETELHQVQYNIIPQDNKFYAISWHEGAFDLEKAKSNKYKNCYVSDSLQELKNIVYQAVEKEKQYKKQIEELAKIETELHQVQYNIIPQDDKFYAIAWHEGAFDLEKAKNNKYKNCYVSDSLQELKRIVYQSVEKEKQYRKQIEAELPKIADELHRVQYNVIPQDDKYYAIAWHEGAFDLEKAKNNKYKNCYVSDSLQELKNIVYQAVEKEKQYKKQIEAELPQIADELHGIQYNIVSQDGKFYAIALHEGAFDLEKAKNNKYKNCYVSDSLKELRFIVYHAIGKDIKPVLLETGYRGFDIIFDGELYWAFYAKDGIFDMAKALKKEYTNFSGISIDEIKCQVDRFASKDKDSIYCERCITQELAKKNFNVVHYENKFYALAMSEGGFDWAKAQNNQYKECYSADTICDLKRMVENQDRGIDNSSKEVNIVPYLMEEGYKGFNIISYDKKYYGLAQGAGAFDINKIHTYKYCFKGDSIPDVKLSIDNISSQNQNWKNLLSKIKLKLKYYSSSVWDKS